MARLQILDIRISSDTEMEELIATEMEANSDINSQQFNVGSGMAWPIVNHFTEEMLCSITLLREFNSDKSRGLIEVVFVHHYSDEHNGQIVPQYVRGIEVSCYSVALRAQSPFSHLSNVNLSPSLNQGVG